MENLGIDFKLLIAQAFNFALFFWIYKKYISKPFMSFLKQEKEKEKEKADLAKSLDEQKQALDKEEKQLKEKMRKETVMVINQAKKEAEKVRAEIIAQAKKEADDFKKRSKKQMDEERNIMDKEIREKISSFSVMIVEKALKESLTDEARKDITQYILKNLDYKDLNYEN